MEPPLLWPSVAWSCCLLSDPDELVWTMSKRCHVPTSLQFSEQAVLGSPASWHVSSRLCCSVSNPQEGKARELLFHFPGAFCFLFYFLAQTKASPTVSEPSEKNNPLNASHQGLYLQPRFPSDLVSLHPYPTDILLPTSPTPCSTH